MQLADTKTVRNIVNKIVGTSARYTDMGANNTRLLAWEIRYNEQETLLKEIKEVFALVGFSNRVKTNTSGYNNIGCLRSGGQTWLRINASFKE